MVIPCQINCYMYVTCVQVKYCFHTSITIHPRISCRTFTLVPVARIRDTHSILTTRLVGAVYHWKSCQSEYSWAIGSHTRTDWTHWLMRNAYCGIIFIRKGQYSWTTNFTRLCGQNFVDRYVGSFTHLRFRQTKKPEI